MTGKEPAGDRDAGPATAIARRASGCEADYGGSRRASRCGWPSARPTCSGPARASTCPGLDVSELDHVLSVDPERLVAQVQGMTTYEQLVDATLPRRARCPWSCPQLKTITLGGAVTGLGIESSSFRNGLPHESVREMEILTGSGEVVVARADNEHADLFRGLPQLLRLARLRAAPARSSWSRVHRFVRLRHVRFHDLDSLLGRARRRGAHPPPRGRGVDFVDGVVFSRRGVVPDRRARWADEAPVGQRLHRPGDLLPLDPAAAGRPPHRPRLPVALGHRLVLVLPGVRGAEPAGAPAVAAALPAQRRLLAAGPLREPAPAGRRGGTGGADRPPASGWCRTSRSRSGAPPSSCGGSCARSRSSRSGCARWRCVTPPRAGAAGRSTRWSPARPTSTSASGRRCAHRPGRRGRRRQPRHRAAGARAGRPQVALLRLLLRRGRVLVALRRRDLRPLKKTYDPDGRLPGLYEKAVRRR